MASKERFYINMNDGRVISGTEETKHNVFYREIDESYAFAIRDGKITAKEVIDRVNAKVGMIPFSEMMASVQKLNVRTKDLHMEEHAKGADAADDAGEPSGVLGKFEGKAAASEKPVKTEATPTAERKAVKVVM